MLRICLFGNFEASVEGRGFPRFATRRATGLFALLVLSRGKANRRESLATQFWHDLPSERSRRALNTEVWRIANAVKRAGIEPHQIIEARTDALTFRPLVPVWVDTEAFEAAVGRTAEVAPEQADNALLDALGEGVALYRGDLLEDCYFDWCLLHREALRLRFLAALEFLMAAFTARQAWSRAIEAGNRLLAADPLQEHVHRALMRCHYQHGNRPAAVRQFALCRDYLRDELGIDPMEETRRVYETIVAVAPRQVAERPQVAGPQSARAHPSRRTPLQEISLAIANIDTARGWLADASQQLANPDPR